VLDGKFTSVLQAVGVPRTRADGGTSLYLERWVEEAKASGLVARLLERHGVQGKLSVAQ
jgi:polar amino acid transport system substrate-binding protein